MSGLENDAGVYPPGAAPSGEASSSFSISENNALSNSPYDATYDENIEPMIYCQPAKPQRIRRRAVTGPDHIKHRRTRSGCYTCRSRRVKCDETHPTCNRCRKGQRECVFPGTSPQSSKDSERGARDSPTSSNEYEDDASPETKLATIPDEDEGYTYDSQQSRQPSWSLRRTNTAPSLSMHRLTTQHREMSETPSQDENRSSSATMSDNTSFDVTPTGTWMPESVLGRKPDWRHLPPDFRIYLDYYAEHITHWKYGVHTDFDDFFHTTFINLALQNEPLLYAVVGFAAFKRMLQDPNGQIHDFLQYYTRSVTLLLGILKKREEKHDVATLLTILQLATLEPRHIEWHANFLKRGVTYVYVEFFGDYTNLMAHQRAALEILTQLFTPQTILQTSVGRVILAWYHRFDMFSASVGTSKPSIPRGWIEASDSYCQARALCEPESTEWMCDKTQSRLGVIGVDMCLLAARRKAGEITTEEEFSAEHQSLTTRLREWRVALPAQLTDPANLAPTSSNAASSSLFTYHSAPAEGTAVPMFAEPLCFTTAIICEWHSLVLMHLCQATGDAAAQAAAEAQLGDLAQHAAAICAIIEALVRWPRVPKGLLMMLHPVLGIAAVFLPRSSRHHMWLREQFAWLESCGYVFPVTMRAQMAHMFEDETVVRWWLPNDEGFSPVLQRVRAFADERSHSPATAQAQNSHLSASGDITDVFDSLVDLRLHDPRVESP